MVIFHSYVSLPEGIKSFQMFKKRGEICSVPYRAQRHVDISYSHLW